MNVQNINIKIGKIQKLCLKLILDDYEYDYGTLIKKNGTTTMEIKRSRNLATEIFKTISNINPSYMKKQTQKYDPHDIIVRHQNIASYGDRNLSAPGPKI